MNLSQEVCIFELFMMLLENFETISQLNLCIRSNTYISLKNSHFITLHARTQSRINKKRCNFAGVVLNTYSAKILRK